MHTTGNTTDLRRSDIWSTQLKDILRDELMMMTYVNWINDFPDGDTFHIPSIGQADVDNYEEDELIVYRPMDTGEFTFTIDQYKSSGTYITKKAEQDLFYSQQLVSRFVPEQERALMETLESDILNLQRKQTAGDTNRINGGDHRYVASGASNSMTPEDFAKANYTLNRSNVSSVGRVGIVDPSVAYDLETMTNLVNVSNNPMWEGIVSTGISTGMRFVKNVYGFDIYVSNRLDEVASETVGGSAVTDGKANIFFSADSSQQPFIGAWRQMPMVDEEYNKDRQRTEYVTTARYGVDLYRPESLVTILSEVNL